MVPCLLQRKEYRPDSAKGSMAARYRSTFATSRCDGANAKKYVILLTGRVEHDCSYGPGLCSGRSGHGSKADANVAADVRPANVLAAAYVWNAATNDAAAHDAVAYDGPTTRLWSATHDGSATDGSTITTNRPATNGQ